MKTRLFLALGLLVATVALFWWAAPRPQPIIAPATPGPTAMPPHDAPVEARHVSPPAATPLPPPPTSTTPAPAARAPAPMPVPPALEVAPPSPAEPAPPPTANVQEDLDAVDLMFRDYRSAMGENPVGGNAEIMRALLGNNLKQVKMNLPNGSRLNGEGELVDRWGTPYFFHQLSGRQMEVRSAGEDRRMWTGDDAVIGKAPAPP